MDELIVKDVDFNGATLRAVQDNDKTVWAGVRWICDGIGFSKGQMQNERKRLQTDLVLSKGERNFVLPTNGGKQDVQCLKLDFLPLWLAKISITPKMQRDNPELVDKLITYQLKAKDVLASAFLPEYTEQKPVQTIPSINLALPGIWESIWEIYRLPFIHPMTGQVVF